MRPLDFFRTRLLKQAHSRIGELETRLRASQEMLLECAEATTLVNITRNGRELVLTFSRKGEIYRMTVYATMSFNIEQWRSMLEKKP